MQKSQKSGWRAMTAAFTGALISIALLGAAASSAPVSSDAKTSPTATAKTAPAVSVAKTAQLKDMLVQAKGKVVVLNFWGTFCPPCVAEMPEFGSFYKCYQGKDVVLLSVNCDDPGDANTTVKSFIESKKIPFRVTVLDDAPDVVSKILGTTWDGGLPATYVYDTTGKLAKTIEGQTTAKELSALVDPLLPKKNFAK